METKIISVNFIDPAQVPKITQRETANVRMINTIIENLTKAPAGKHLLIDLEGLKDSTRYNIQKGLQKRGHKVVMVSGTNPASGRPCLFLKRLSDAEFREWQGMAPAQPKRK